MEGLRIKQVKMKKFLLLYLTLTTVVLFSSCDSKRIYEENYTIPDQVWNSKNVMVYGVDIEDTLTPCNVYVNVRNASDYPFSNLYLFLETRYPDNKISKDTLECVLADATGKWLGNGSGDIWDNQFLFKKNVMFKRKGKYFFNLEQAMRMQNLPQILDVGIRIEKAK
jgi:gliding motility-associated lipoprotein GldH